MPALAAFANRAEQVEYTRKTEDTQRFYAVSFPYLSFCYYGAMREENYKTAFKGKKITMLGLGLLGRGVNVAKFLSKLGAELTVTDLKSAEALAPSLKQLSKYKNIRFVLGRHDLKDFQKCDMVIKAAGVPLDSVYVAEAKKNNIPVEMDASLFAKFTKGTLVGVTGTRGKTTTTYLIRHILETAKRGVHLGGNVRGMATLPLLEKVKEGDVIVLELDSWQLQGFGDAKISPRIAVFTNFLPDHLNYYKGRIDWYFGDKANIFKYQKTAGVLVLGEIAAREIKKHFKGKIKSKTIVAKSNRILTSWKIKLLGEHNRANIVCAVEACRALGISEKDIKRGVESFAGVPGRLEYVRTVGGIKYVNDTTATTPDGNRAAILSLQDKKRKNIVLIAGGADKNLDYSDMAKLVHKTVKGLVLIEGAATEKLLALIPKKTPYPVFVVSSMKEALAAARESAKKGDTILLSPGAASFGVFKNEFDRGDQFVVAVRRMK